MTKSLTAMLFAVLMIVSTTAYTVETDIGKTNVVVVTGTAQVRVTPDQATFYAYLQATGKSAQQATDNAETIVDQAIKSLQGIVSKDDIGTSSINVYPIYDYSTGSPVISGYTVYQSLTILIRGVTNNNNKISRTIDALANAGVSSISGINYSSSDPNLGKAEARRQAYNEASDAASQYASLSRRRLGRILKID